MLLKNNQSFDVVAEFQPLCDSNSTYKNTKSNKCLYFAFKEISFPI